MIFPLKKEDVETFFAFKRSTVFSTLTTRWQARQVPRASVTVLENQRKPFSSLQNFYRTGRGKGARELSFVSHTSCSWIVMYPIEIASHCPQKLRAESTIRENYNVPIISLSPIQSTPLIRDSSTIWRSLLYPRSVLERYFFRENIEAYFETVRRRSARKHAAAVPSASWGKNSTQLSAGESECRGSDTIDRCHLAEFLTSDASRMDRYTNGKLERVSSGFFNS